MTATAGRYQRPSDSSGVTDELAEFAASVAIDDIDAETRAFGVQVLLDTVASALAGTHGVESGTIRKMAEQLGSGDTTVIGGTPLSLAGAMLVNGYEVTAVTVCDVHKPLLCHVTPEVVPPALAIAQREHLSGRDLLSAVIVGSEVAIRVGLGLDYTVFRARGWHSPGVIGPFGGAAAVTRLLGGDHTQMRNALGLAGSQSAGTFAAWGTPTIKFHQARGALSGLMAGLLAMEGFAASPDILGHSDGGLFHTHSDGGRPTAVTSGLGSEWEFEQLTLRRWPLASGLQSLVEGMMDVVVSGDLGPDDISEVEVRVPPETYEMFHDFPWETKFQAHLSPRFIASVIAHERSCWLDQFDDSRRHDRSISEFAESRVHLQADPTITGEGAVVVVTTTSGDEHVSSCLVPGGAPERRLTTSDLIDKFNDARVGILDETLATEILDRFLQIDDEEDVSAVVGMLGSR